MKDNFRIACLVLMLPAAVFTSCALKSTVPDFESGLRIFREWEGEKPPTHAENLIATLNQTTVDLLQNGKYAQADTFAHKVSALSKRDLGPEHPETLHALNNLAALYEVEGRYDESEPLYLHVLAAREQALGKDHPDTLLSVNNLAVLYYVQGRYDKAEPLYLRVLAANERVLGKGHSQTLGNINNLAILYQAQGRHDETERLMARAGGANERVPGKELPEHLPRRQRPAGQRRLAGKCREKTEKTIPTPFCGKQLEENQGYVSKGVGQMETTQISSIRSFHGLSSTPGSGPVEAARNRLSGGGIQSHPTASLVVF